MTVCVGGHLHSVCSCVSVVGTEGLGAHSNISGKGHYGYWEKEAQSSWTLGFLQVNFDLWTGILGYRERGGVRLWVHNEVGTKQPGL